MFGILGVGLRFPMLDVGVYESVVDGACGDWIFFCIVVLRAGFWHIYFFSVGTGVARGPSKFMAGPSSSCIKGCFLGLGVLANMYPMCRGYTV